MTHPKTHLLVPLLALGLLLGMTAPNQAQSATSGSISINFGSAPRWSNVSGTSVRMIHDDDRSDYDMFRVGRNYYVYNNDNHRWYMSRRWRGRFVLISDRSVPRELRRVPRDHWRSYPTAWEDRGYRDSYDSYATFRVNFGGRPRWSSINGTRVQTVYGEGRPSYDVFRYGGSYYAYNNDRWYMSSRENGEYELIDARNVPDEFYEVPRTNWRHYPADWDDNDFSGNDRNDSYGTFQVTFGSSPRWTGVDGTRVEMVYGAERPGYDVFRYGGRYYAYNNDRWYSSNRESGQFAMIEERSVPSEISRVPRDQWRRYPTNWHENHGGRRGSRDRDDQWRDRGGN